MSSTSLRRLLPISAILACCAVPAVPAAPASAAEPSSVSAYPAPGTRSASSRTQISLRGLAPSQVGTVRVVGSRSGVHGGRLRAHSDGQGASFVPTKAFREGESVSVTTSLPILGAKSGDFRLRVARTPHREQQGDAMPVKTVAPGKTREYTSRPDLRPPVVTIDKREVAGRGAGLLMMESKPKQPGSRRQQGPMIFDDYGRLVWFKPMVGRTATDVKVQQYGGKPVLTWWEGHQSQGMGRGEYVIVDSNYRTIRRLPAGNGYSGDLHEFTITPQGTALVTIYQQVRRDLSDVRGSGTGIIVDSIVQELDISTGLVLFEWHSLGQVGYRESYSPAPRNGRIPWDYVHANSAKIAPDGDIVVSARNTWAVYKVDRARASVQWRLGGKRNNFKLASGVRFAWQHDAQLHPGGVLTVYDNEASPGVRSRSRALTLAIDEQARSARVLRAITHPKGLLSATQGSVQVDPQGRVFIGWGSRRYFSEYAANGQRLLDGRVAVGYDIYRAYRAPWSARPLSSPRLVAKRRGASRTTAWMSWNGATDVAQWVVLAGPRQDQLTPVARSRRIGFETEVIAPNAGPYFAVQALDAGGSVLATSKVARRSG